jgi:hypothetical protein
MVNDRVEVPERLVDVAARMRRPCPGDAGWFCRRGVRNMGGHIYLVRNGPSDQRWEIVGDLRAIPGTEEPRLIASADEEEDVYIVAWEPTSRWWRRKQRIEAQRSLVVVAQRHRGALWHGRVRRLWEWDGSI